jgi:hypothetical protein
MKEILMTVLIANDAVQTFLAEVREKTEIRDPNGKLLGSFEPHVETEAEMYERLMKRLDPEKTRLRRLEAEKGQGYTIEQVMEHLRSLETKQ